VRNENIDRTSTGGIVGIGLNYALLRSLAVRAEWHRYFDVKGENIDVDIDVLSVGLLYRF
jgi:opacity protein-like surface antigen